MELKNLLDYQKADIAKRNIKSAMHKDVSCQDMRKYRDLYEQAVKLARESEDNANATLNEYESVKAFYEQNCAEIERICARLSLNDISDEEEIELLAKLEQVKATVTEWEKRIGEIKAKAEKLVSDYVKIQKDGLSFKDKYMVAKAEYAKLEKLKEPELAVAQSKMDEIKPSVQLELMEKYEKLTAVMRPPVFVPGMTSDGKQYSCGGCGMGLSNVAKAELEEKGMVVCESCHRLVYKI